MRGSQIVPTHLNGVSADVPAAQRHRQVPQMLGEVCDVCCAATQAAVPGIEAENARLMLKPWILRPRRSHARQRRAEAPQAQRRRQRHAGQRYWPVFGLEEQVDIQRADACTCSNHIQ